MTKDIGRSATRSGSRPSGRASKAVSPVPASIPNAAERLILDAVKRALEPLSSPGMSWQEYYRRLQRTPGAVLGAIRDTGLLFRLPEQADWPLLIEAFQKRPYTLTIRTQLTIGGQTFGYDQQQDDKMLYSIDRRMDRDLAMHMSRRCIRSVLEAVAEPFFKEAARQYAQAIEARRAETATAQIRPRHPPSAGP